MNDDIQQTNERALALVRENEKLIERAVEAIGREERIVKEAGLDPAQYRKWLSMNADPEAEARAQAEFDAEMTELRHEVDAEAARLGLSRPAAGARTRRHTV